MYRNNFNAKFDGGLYGLAVAFTLFSLFAAFVLDVWEPLIGEVLCMFFAFMAGIGTWVAGKIAAKKAVSAGQHAEPPIAS